MQRSRRADLPNDVAEHRPILKTNRTTYYPRFSFTPPKQVYPKTVCFVFTVISNSLKPHRVSLRLKPTTTASPKKHLRHASLHNQSLGSATEGKNINPKKFRVSTHPSFDAQNKSKSAILFPSLE